MTVSVRPFRVGVFPREPTKAGKKRWNAYTMWYHKNWAGCCEHVVNAENGNEAKRRAIAEHGERCEGPK